MAITTNFFDGSSVSGTNLIAPWASMLSDGVFGATDLLVAPSSPTALSVSVGAGSAIKSGYYIKSDSSATIPIAANTSGYNRIDLIVLNIDASNRVTTIQPIQGAPASSPVAPAPASNQLPVAQVLVGNNASVINSTAITDMRQPVLTPSDYAGKGEPFFGPTSAVPWNRLVPDGSLVSRITYRRLFAAVGTIYGAGDGATTFALPDCRGKTLVGYLPGDPGSVNFSIHGSTVGSKTHTQSMTLPTVYSNNNPYVLQGDHYIANLASGQTDSATVKQANVRIVTGTMQDVLIEIHTETMTGSSVQPSLVINHLIVW